VYALSSNYVAFVSEFLQSNYVLYS